MRVRERLRARDAAAARYRTGFGAVLAALTILWGFLAFGWPALVAGAVLALALVLVARLQATAPRAILALWHLVALPAVAGTVLAATPFDIWFLAAPVLLALWLCARVPDRLLLGRSTLPARAAGLLMLALTLVVCDRLPVKPLDRKVGPAEYRRVPLGELQERLYRERSSTSLSRARCRCGASSRSSPRKPASS